MMTISVLMSVYKSERSECLDEALASVWTAQTLKPRQIILVEDGPLTDGLYETIEKWKRELGDVLLVLANVQNLGLTKSLNIGLSHVTSDLVARMDSDDISMPTRFEKQVKYLEAHPDVSVVGGAMQEFNSENPCVNVRHYPRTNADVLRSIYKACPIAHPTAMMRMAMFREGGLRYDERFRTSQDIALWYDAVCAGYKIANLDEVTFRFRLANDMFKRRSRAKAWNEFRIYMSGVRRLYGLFTPKYVYPISRLMFRLMPVKVVKMVYGSNLRARIVENKSK